MAISTKKNQKGVSQSMQCQRNGRILRRTFTPGERLCTRCGKKVYCPVCTTTFLPRATLVYCVQHAPLEAEIEERSIRP